MANEIIIPGEAQMKSLKSLTLAVYILYAFHFFYFITAIIGVMINFISLAVKIPQRQSCHSSEPWIRSG